ncbi:MAG: DUF368 domain-containing protein [Erysipelotrichaceae bacterium]|nr:DUF368 domain-containing protein [Erysipelotrichaceae bacterium]
MLRNLIGGIAIGIANIIPGVSGGTMMVILGLFQKTMDAISGFFQPHNPKRKEQFLFLLQVLIGAAIGLIGFAKLLNILFEEYPTQTIYWFIGLVVFSIPLFLKAEVKDEKLSWLWVAIGMALIFAINLMAPGSEEGVVNPTFPAITPLHCVLMVAVGFVGGFAMLMPGVSGSMVLLIFGQYYLFKSYVAAVTSFAPDVLLSLVFIAIGIGLGIVTSAIVTNAALKKNKSATLSFILGLIIASSMVLIPFDVSYDLGMIVTCLMAVGFGGLIVSLLNRFA